MYIMDRYLRSDTPLFFYGFLPFRAIQKREREKEINPLEMRKKMDHLKAFFKEEVVKKVSALVLLVVILWSIRGLLNLLLLTFIFSYLLNSLQQVLYRSLSKMIPIKEKIVTIGMYAVILFAIVFGLATYINRSAKELTGIAHKLISFNLETYTNQINPNVEGFLKGLHLESYTKGAVTTIFHAIPHVSEFSIQLIMAFILSFFLLNGKKEIRDFCKKLEKSKISFLYSYYKYLGTNFANTFGKILQLQILISLINAVLSMIFLAILGFHQVVGLGCMMFLFGLIPVVGAIISFIPLAIIAFTMGGIPKVLWIVVMVLGLHAMESYVLNPRLMAHATKLPIFLAFLTLIISEYFLGTWGLLLGIPLLMFLLDLFNIQTKEKTA
jgi:predicted PurR-regulated permease PerM